MRMILGALVLCLAGCGGSGSIGGTATPPSTGVTPAETVFVGDSILAGWTLAPSGNTVVIQGGSAEDFADQFGSKCVAGCTPSQFQTEAAGKKRMVLIVGAFDAAELCTENRDDRFSDYYAEMLRSATNLYGLQVVAATVPQSYDINGNPTCAAFISQVNGEIRTAATAAGAQVFDLNAVLDSSEDFNLQDPSGTVTIPNAAGYAAMTSAYSQIQ